MQGLTLVQLQYFFRHGFSHSGKPVWQNMLIYAYFRVNAAQCPPEKEQAVAKL
jgi:hypothetical protein